MSDDVRQRAEDLLYHARNYLDVSTFGSRDEQWYRGKAVDCANRAADNARAANAPLLAEFARRCADVAEGAG